MTDASKKRVPARARAPVSALLRRRRRELLSEAARTPGARLRVYLRSWLLWGLAGVADATWKQWLGALLLAVSALVAFVFAPPGHAPARGLRHEFAIESDEFLGTIQGTTGARFTSGNRVDVLVNGDEFYPAMLAAIRGARRSVTLEEYMFKDGEIGRRFADEFAAKARDGVPVKLLLDAFGSADVGAEIVRTLVESGCEVQWYHPVSWYTLDRYNNRTHRKTLVVDGAVGFTGGAGIADEWLGDAEGVGHWRDTMVRVEGPAVLTLQTGFARNWLEVTGSLVTGEEYFPPPAAAGTLRAEAVLSSPDSAASRVSIMYVLSIACARESILIANPYFIPSDAAIELLVDAERRGVDVKVMVAGDRNDSDVARLNSTRLYGRLLRAGVEIFEYDRTFAHHKFMVCDGLWSTIGTTNFDNRSFELNDESNVCVLDAGFAARLAGVFSDDLGDCHAITLEAWERRGAAARVREIAASLLRDQV